MRGRVSAVKTIHRPGSLLLVASVPALVILASYGMTPYFDARYAIMVLPAWVVLIVRGTRYAIDRMVIRGKIYRYVRVGRMLLLLAVLANVANVFEPTRGIYSGAPVKEQWREVVTELAHRVTRDDLVVVHPAYAEPLYWYYARVTRDPLPKPVVFPHFSDGFRGVSPERTAEIEYQRRLFEAELNQAARGKHRAFLLIAPDHANQVDPPIDGVNPHGRVWLYFHYPQRSWPCGGVDRYGVSLMCQSYPSAYGTDVVPQPEKAINALFGEQIKLRVLRCVPLGTVFGLVARCRSNFFGRPLQYLGKIIESSCICVSVAMNHLWHNRTAHPFTDMGMQGG